MIKYISIQNIAIAENVEVEFECGLNVVTGETGAGKSLLVDALSLLRGAKVDIGLIRSGCASAQITAIFVVPQSSRVLSILGEHGIVLDAADEIFLRRVIQKNGKHKAFINDTPVNLKTLQYIAEELIDISSQFENQRLLSPSSHTFYLDTFALTAELAVKVLSKFEKSNALIRELNEIEQRQIIQKREKDLLEFELNEIDEAAISLVEFQEIEHTLLMGKKTDAVQFLCDEAVDLLDNNEICCINILKSVKKNIEKLEKLLVNTSCDVKVCDVQEVLIITENLVEKIASAKRFLTIDEDELKYATERIEIYNKLLSKFGPGIENIFSHRETCVQVLSKIDALGSKKESMLDELQRVITDLVTDAEKLSGLRKNSLLSLSKAVELELKDLGMAKTKFICECTPCLPRQIDFSIAINNKISEKLLKKFTALCKFGYEEVRFLLGANLGLEPMSLEKIASGGELSRIMLAIKTVLFADESVSLFVFDEIDTGISGAIAAKVGQKLAKFCFDRQAICITHLPQVACYGKQHFVVKKRVENGKACTEIRELSVSERPVELASLLAGERVSKEGLAHSKALLDEAKIFLAKLHKNGKGI